MRNQIDDALRRLMGEKPELATVNLKNIRKRLAEAERSRKMPNVSGDELQRLRRGQISEQEWGDLRKVVRTTAPKSDGDATTSSERLRDAIEWAEEHLFDRRSVVPEFQIWQSALERARGREIDVQELKAATRRRGYLRGEDGDGQDFHLSAV